MQVNTRRRLDDAQMSWHEIALSHYWFRLRVYISLSNQCGKHLGGTFYRFLLVYSWLRDLFSKVHYLGDYYSFNIRSFPHPLSGYKTKGMSTHWLIC